MADLYSVLALSTTVKEKKKREETDTGGGEIERFERNPVCPLAAPFFRLFLAFSFTRQRRVYQHEKDGENRG